MNSAIGPVVLGLGALAALIFSSSESDAATGGGGGGEATPEPTDYTPQTPFAEKEAETLYLMIQDAANSDDPTYIRAQAQKIRNTKWSDDIKYQAIQAANDLDALAYFIEAQQQSRNPEYGGTAENAPSPWPWEGIDVPDYG